MANKMDCKDYEEKISEVLDKKELSQEILSHINKCKTCMSFYEYIKTLKANLKGIEILEPSPDFDIRIIKKLKARSPYWRILTLASSFVTFVSFLFISVIAKRYFAETTVFLGKILKTFEVLSGIFSYGFYTVVILLFLSATFLVIAFSVFDMVLLSKLIKNGGRT